MGGSWLRAKGGKAGWGECSRFARFCSHRGFGACGIQFDTSPITRLLAGRDWSNIAGRTSPVAPFIHWLSFSSLLQILAKICVRWGSSIGTYVKQPSGLPWFLAAANRLRALNCNLEKSNKLQDRQYQYVERSVQTCDGACTIEAAPVVRHKPLKRDHNCSKAARSHHLRCRYCYCSVVGALAHSDGGGPSQQRTSHSSAAHVPSTAAACCHHI